MQNNIKPVPYWRQVVRCIIHIPHGTVITYLCMWNWIIGIIWAVYFLVYELNEDMYLKDNAWVDIKGCLIGIPIPFFIELILSWR